MNIPKKVFNFVNKFNTAYINQAKNTDDEYCLMDSEGNRYKISPLQIIDNSLCYDIEYDDYRHTRYNESINLIIEEDGEYYFNDFDYDDTIKTLKSDLKRFKKYFNEFGAKESDYEEGGEERTLNRIRQQESMNNVSSLNKLIKEIDEFKSLFSEKRYEYLLESLLTEASLTDVYNKYYSDKMPKEHFQRLSRIDPSYNANKPDKMGKFTQWLCNMYLNDKDIIFNLDPLQDMLNQYYRNQNLFGNTNIKNIKTFEQFDELLSSVLDEDGNVKSNIQSQKVREGSNIVFNNDEWEIIIPLNYEASRYWGQDTSWCTAAGNNGRYSGEKMFNHYSEQSPLYINIDKRDGSKYQFHANSKQFKNSDDEEILDCFDASSVDEAINMPKEVKQWYADNDKNIYRLISNYAIKVYFKEDVTLELEPNSDGYYSLYDSINDFYLCDNLNGKYDIIQTNRIDYIKFENIDAITLVSIEGSEVSILTENAYHIDTETFEDFDIIALYTKGDNGNLFTLFYTPSTYKYYQCDASEIESYDYLSSQIIKIEKANGLLDLVSIGYDTVYEDVEIVKSDEYDENITIRNKYGKVQAIPDY